MTLAEFKEFIPLGVLVFFVLYTGAILGAISWMLNAKLNPIEKLLSNHITDTNKKIDKLNETIKEDKKELKEDMKDGFKNINSRLDKFLQDNKN